MLVSNTRKSFTSSSWMLSSAMVYTAATITCFLISCLTATSAFQLLESTSWKSWIFKTTMLRWRVNWLCFKEKYNQKRALVAVLQILKETGSPTSTISFSRFQNPKSWLDSCCLASKVKNFLTNFLTKMKLSITFSPYCLGAYLTILPKSLTNGSTLKVTVK